jgi:hypothetical protein
MVLRPEDFGPTHRCDPTTSPGLTAAESFEWCVRTPPAQTEGDEACVLSGAFLFGEISDAQRFYSDFEQGRRLDQARRDGLEVREGQTPELGDQAALHIVGATSVEFCELAGTPANAVWVSIREGKVVLRLELWAIGQTASTDEALDLAGKQLMRAEMMPTLQPSQMLLQQSDLPPGYTLGRDVTVGLWGRATAFTNEEEGATIGSLALPFRTADEAAETLTTAQLSELPTLTLGDSVPVPVEPEEELAPVPPVGDSTRVLSARTPAGQEVHVVAFARGPGLMAVVSVAQPGRLTLEQLAELAARMDSRTQAALD